MSRGTRRRLRIAALVLFVAAAVISLVLIPGGGSRPPVPPREREARFRIVPRAGLLPRLRLSPTAVDGSDAGLGAAASLVGDVLRADLAFEEVFELASAADGVDETAVGADGVLSATVRREDGELHLELRLSDPRSGQLAFGREFVGAQKNPRLIAHIAANELLADQAGVKGVADSRLAFVSDRLGSFHEPTGSVRRVKEIFVADYDGANEQRVTVDGDLDMTPAWSPDRRAIAYTSLRTGAQEIFITRLDDRRVTSVGVRGQNRLPAWSSDGTRIAFSSNRDGNEEIYVMNADGSGARRLTTSWAIDTAPSWSPDGRQIAFTSDRTGSPQIWVMDADGGNQRQLTREKYCDRPSWSPGPADEVAYVSRTKTGYDIKVIEPSTGNARQLTFGPQNESPAFSPNGRHIAFTSTRGGGQQIWTMSRTGSGLRQVTHIGNNSMVAWSR